MADENDPDRPEDDPPPNAPDPDQPEAPKPSEDGETPPDQAAEPVEQTQPTEPEDMLFGTRAEEAPAAEEPNPPAEPDPPQEIVVGPEIHGAPSDAEEHAPEAEPQPEAEEEAFDEPTPELIEPTGQDLPSGYFRAAGDPDEPPPEPDRSLGGQLTTFSEKLGERWRRWREKARPHVEQGWRRTRQVAGQVAQRANQVAQRAGELRPKSVREAAIWSGWAAGGVVALVLGFFVFVTWGMPSTDDLWEARNGQSITFLDRNGHVILREGAQNAPPVELTTLPPYVAQAFIAIEDQRFYDHLGVDFGGMMRAAAENVRSGRVVQGGSTITQQLAKNLFLTNERSWRRKAQEIALAIWLEGRFTKDEILALYLSRVYFGAGAYGIEAAAERYFDRPARELTLLQSATLAGLVKAPSRMNPARQDLSAARERAELVLAEMVNEGFISDSERQAALQEELIVSRRNPAGILGYYRDWIDPLLNEVIGTDRDDFIIETTLDIAAQRAGSEAVETVLAEQGEDRRVGQAGLIAIDNEGGVRTMVGGRDYDISQFNRATQARRQPGSSFKFFIYLAAMEQGLSPWTVREDAPITISIEGQPDWTPGNYENEFNGPTPLDRAFALSYNMVAIRVSHETGGQNVIDVARRLGVESPLHNYHSLALGAQEITLLEMTQAYGVMANDGYRVATHGVARIRRANNGEVMWSFRAPQRELLIEERPRRYMNYMMSHVVQWGTGTRARMADRQIAGKTGTGNDYRDAWFVGFTPGIAAGVWVGNDNFTITNRVTGGSLPADIWARYMNVALRGMPARDLDMPRPEDEEFAFPQAEIPEIAVVGAPLGAGPAPPTAPPTEGADRSLDLGPEG